MEVLGYSHELRAQPGESLAFSVSCTAASYNVEIIRILHGDPNPAGPGQKFLPINANCNGTYSGHAYSVRSGSWMLAQQGELPTVDAFSVGGWLFPTTLGDGRRQVVFSQGLDRAEWAFGFDAKGCPFVDFAGKTILTIDRQMPKKRWLWAAVAWDGRMCRLLLRIENQDLAASGEGYAEQTISGNFIIAAAAGRDWPDDHFDGKVEMPWLFSRAISDAEACQLRDSGDPIALDGCIGAWDFNGSCDSMWVPNRVTGRADGKLFNLPMRALTGHRWRGQAYDWQAAPELYGAIFFHAEDTGPFDWPEAFRFNIPDDLPSGVYAARLTSAQGVDHVPFFIRPPTGHPTSKIAFLAPTFSYLAYSNEQIATRPDVADVLSASALEGAAVYPRTAGDAYVSKHRILSLYDKRVDGSGVCYVAKRRPHLSMRPDYYMPLLWQGGAPHQLCADLHLIDWLAANDFDHDVLTDEDLHHEGISLLEPYRLIVTGTHPEYWSEAMLDGLEAYLNGGGRLLYLGGNGFYWVTSLERKNGDYIEVRRGLGSGAWRAHPAEEYHSTTGEKGGLWRFRGRPPQAMVGVGMSSMGNDDGRPYIRSEASHDPRWNSLFQGMEAEAQIGDVPSLVFGSGAGGFEVDRADFELGTPTNATVLATARVDSGDSYQELIEELDAATPFGGGTINPKVRADMVWVDYPNGGAVWSVGSILWCSCLSHNAYENSVSRMTENAINAMLSSV